MNGLTRRGGGCESRLDGIFNGRIFLSLSLGFPLFLRVSKTVHRIFFSSVDFFISCFIIIIIILFIFSSFISYDRIARLSLSSK